MPPELIIGIVGGVVLPIVFYFLGVRHERARQKREDDRELRRQEADRRLEEERRQHERVSKVADQYADLVHRHQASGVYALQRLGLDVLVTTN